MADIFISYSSHDREKAEQLTELLSSAGLSVWIDQSGIEAATSWSGEIVDAINECKVLIALLSANSIESHNVIKEVSLASEKRKRILPLDLEPVTLPRELEYQLAGIQRAPMTNIDAIIRALGKLGIQGMNSPTPPKIVKEERGKKSLMVLPFEDLSPTGDNQWFADGLASELVGALSNIGSLRVADYQTTKDFRSFRGRLTEWGREVTIRYFIEGQVRKFGDRIKIALSLLDLETGDHLWQDSWKGVMSDVFQIQEQVAEKVVVGLRLHLTSDEKQKLAARGTENADAYELYLKAVEYFSRASPDGLDLACQLFAEAIKLDPGYVDAYIAKAQALLERHRNFNHNDDLLREAAELVSKAKQLKQGDVNVERVHALILMQQGHAAEAEHMIEQLVLEQPDNPNVHFTRGYVYSMMNRHSEAITSLETAARLLQGSITTWFNLSLACAKAGDVDGARRSAETDLTLVEKHLKLFPDDEWWLVNHALLLHFAGRNEEARIEIENTDAFRNGLALYNKAFLWCRLKDYTKGIASLRRSVEMGYRNIELLRYFLSDDIGGIGSLRDTREWADVNNLICSLQAMSDAINTNG